MATSTHILLRLLQLFMLIQLIWLDHSKPNQNGANQSTASPMLLRLPSLQTRMRRKHSNHPIGSRRSGRSLSGNNAPPLYRCLQWTEVEPTSYDVSVFSGWVVYSVYFVPDRAVSGVQSYFRYRYVCWFFFSNIYNEVRCLKHLCVEQY